MKNLLLVLLIGLSLTACKKEVDTTEIIVDPPTEKILSRDTITSGQLWGFTIGQPSANVYANVQQVKIERKIGYVGVVGNVFTSLDGLESKIPLYLALYLDEAVGTGTGIQIYFENNKVKSIWTNNGAKLSKWPAANSSNASVAVGDAVNDIYTKLVNIKKMSSFANKFERISVSQKDFNKAYDPGMVNSRLWYVNGNIDDKKYYRLELNFTAGTLVSIYSTLLEKY